MSFIGRALLVLASAGAGVGLGYVAYLRTTPKPAAPSATASASPSASATGGPEASAAPSGEPLAASAADASSASASHPVDAVACMKPLFAADSFSGATPSLGDLCDGEDALKLTELGKELAIEAGHGSVTPAMKEWASTGYYRLAIVAALRGRCCPDAPALAAPPPPGKCESVAAALAEIAHAAAPNGQAAALETAAKDFDTSVRCIASSGSTQPYWNFPALGGGEASTFERTIKRIYP